MKRERERRRKRETERREVSAARIPKRSRGNGGGSTTEERTATSTPNLGMAEARATPSAGRLCRTSKKVKWMQQPARRRVLVSWTGLQGVLESSRTEILGGWRTKQAKHEPDGAVHQAASIYHGHYSVLMTL